MDEALLDLERRFWRAGGDPGFYREHLADDARCVFGFGSLDKAATMASIEQATPWVTVEFLDLQVIEVAPAVTALVYTAEAEDRDGFRYRAAVSSVYVERDGARLLVLHQQSPAPNP